MFGLKRRAQDKARIEQLDCAIAGYREVARATSAQAQARRCEIAELRARLAQVDTGAPITREVGIDDTYTALHIAVDVSFPELHISQYPSDEQLAVEEEVQNAFNKMVVDLRELDPAVGMRIKIQWHT